MIHSMTGYAVVERSDERRTLSIEIRSVNNRYLDVSLQLPSYLAALEREIRSAVGSAASRGKVDLSVRLRERIDAQSVEVDEGAVRAAREALDRVARLAGVSAEPTLADIMAFDGVIATARTRDVEEYRSPVLEVLAEALASWNAQRAREGEATREDIARQLARVRESARVFTTFGPRVETSVFESVRTRFREVLGDEADEQRIYAEAASLIVRYSTNEEMVRLASHLAACETMLRDGGQVGKRLDFLCQEVNREINTIASKTIFPEVQAAVVEAKDAVEAIREQVRNLE